MSARDGYLTGWELSDKYQRPFRREEIKSPAAGGEVGEIAVHSRFIGRGY